MNELNFGKMCKEHYAAYVQYVYFDVTVQLKIHDVRGVNISHGVDGEVHAKSRHTACCHIMRQRVIFLHFTQNEIQGQPKLKILKVWCLV